MHVFHGWKIRKQIKPENVSKTTLIEKLLNFQLIKCLNDQQVCNCHKYERQNAEENWRMPIKLLAHTSLLTKTHISTIHVWACTTCCGCQLSLHVAIVVIAIRVAKKRRTARWPCELLYALHHTLSRSQCVFVWLHRNCKCHCCTSGTYGILIAVRLAALTTVQFGKFTLQITRIKLQSPRSPPRAAY